MLSRPFVALYITVFVAVMGISMVSPLLPVYSRELGANGVWLGLTFSAFAVSQAIAGPVIGRLSDRMPRKPFILGGLLIYFVAALGYLIATDFYQVIAFRAFSGLGTSAIFSVSRAFVGDLTPRGHEGRWFGVFATADVLGFGTGPLVAGVIREHIGFDAVFIAMAVMMALSAIIVYLFVPGRVEQRHLTAGEPVRTLSFREAMRDRLVLALTINAALISVTFGASFSFLGLRLEDDLGIGPTLIGLAISTQDLTAGLSQPFFGRLADRRERGPLVATGLLALGLLLIALGAASNYWLVVLILLGMGAANALAAVAASAIQVVAGRRVGMGTVLGLNSMGNGVGILIGSIVGGVLVTALSIPAAFLFSGVIVIAGAPLFLAMTRGLAMRDDAVPLPELAMEPAAAAQ